MLSQRIRDKIDSLLYKEKGTIYKDPGGRINICLVYPNTYFVGMSNLGFQGIYALLNSREDVVCERAFLPCTKALYPLSMAPNGKDRNYQRTIKDH